MMGPHWELTDLDGTVFTDKSVMIDKHDGLVRLLHHVHSMEDETFSRWSWRRLRFVDVKLPIPRRDSLFTVIVPLSRVRHIVWKDEVR